MRVLKNAPFDLLIIGLCIHGFYMGNSVSYNLAYFMLWAIAVLGCLLHLKEVKAALHPINKAKGKRSKAFKAWDIGTDWIILLLPVGAGMWVLGIFLLIATAAKQSLSSAIDKEIDDEQTIDGH